MLLYVAPRHALLANKRAELARVGGGKQASQLFSYLPIKNLQWLFVHDNMTLKLIVQTKKSGLSELASSPNKYICGLLISEISSSIFVVGGYSSANSYDGHIKEPLGR